MLLYLDCDTGIDDALAIGLLLAHDDVRLIGIGTVNGNTSAVQAAANTAGLLALAGRADIPVAVGVGEHHDGAHHVHGDNGVGGVVLPEGRPHDPRTAAGLLVDLAREHAGALHVLATGPCTNLAAALRAEPRLPDLVASVTVMGGALRVRGNVNPHAEFNIAVDPAAAAAVFAAGWAVTLVPLDVTLDHRWTTGDWQRLGGSPLNDALHEMLPVYFDAYETRFEEREIALHDPLAAAVAVGDVTPGDAPLLKLGVDPATGRVVQEAGAGPRVRVVLSLTAPAGPAMLDRLLRGAGAGPQAASPEGRQPAGS
ncbi:nucleoside hydrolase [Actinoplanes sp. NPDC051343]|uniref:nucleoside hydrolase n=1 Tax=Actinoplanes sp. NPDC051343 TaxID=3363906 RepID=UPI00379BFF49